MSTILDWPDTGTWLLSQPKSPFKEDPPFAVLEVNFRTKTGTIRVGRTNTKPISGLRLIQSEAGPTFTASYSIGKHSGTFAATVYLKYVLEIEFKGTCTTSVNARPTKIVGGDSNVGSMGTKDKLQEAIRRALPLMPSQVQREVRALFTPVAIGVLAGLAALWIASHSVAVGWLADLALIVTGAVLLGKVACDVAIHLANFMVGACGAQTHEDLDKAAEDFAAAVLLGGTTLVATLLFSKRVPGGQVKHPGPPVKPGQLPTQNNMVPASRIPAASRVSLKPQGDQPKLVELSKDVREAVVKLLNKIRRENLMGKDIDCTEAAQALDRVSGKKGIVGEYSGTSKPASISDHRIWKIGNEYVCAVPAWWKNLFKSMPSARRSLDALVPGLSRRLEQGAVMNSREYFLYRYGTEPPRSRMFSNERVLGAPKKSKAGS